MAERARYVLAVPPEFERILKSLKKQPSLLKDLELRIERVVREPELGKPLRNVLRNYRRVHIGSHVLIYEIRQNEVRLMDFDHHDRVYKKYR